MKFDKFPKGYFTSREAVYNGKVYFKNEYEDKYGEIMYKLPNGEMVYGNNHGKRTKRKRFINRINKIICTLSLRSDK